MHAVPCVKNDSASQLVDLDHFAHGDITFGNGDPIHGYSAFPGLPSQSQALAHIDPCKLCQFGIFSHPPY